MLTDHLLEFSYLQSNGGLLILFMLISGGFTAIHVYQEWKGTPVPNTSRLKSLRA